MSQNVWATIMPFGPVTNFLLALISDTDNAHFPGLVQAIKSELVLLTKSSPLSE